MATKKDLLFFKDNRKSFDIFSSTDNDNQQFSNLNLNQNFKSSNISSSSSFVQSFNKSKNDNKKLGKKERLLQSFLTNMKKRLQQHLKLSVSSDFDNYKGQKSWGKNKSTKIDHFSDSLNICVEIDKDNNVKKQWNLSNPSNNSTLSLHIAAYENSFEGGTDTVSADKNEDLKESALIKKWKNAKQVFLDSSTLQNPFEFPRQQAEDQNVKSDVKPEIMQFKASQKLLNPNELIALSNDQNENKRDKLAPPSTPTSIPTPAPTPTISKTPAPTPTISKTATPTPTISKTPTPKTSNPSTDKLINEHVLKTKNTVTKVFGTFNEYQLLQADKDYDACPFLAVEKYDDSEGRLKKISRILAKNSERQNHEFYRIRLEEEESETYEIQKLEYSEWNQRRKHHQEFYSTPFCEPSPKVSQKVKDFFAKKDIDDLF